MISWRLFRTILFSGLLVIFLTASCCSDKADGTISFYLTTTEQSLMQDVLDDVEYHMDVVEGLAINADQNTVFDYDGNTGWYNFMVDVKGGLYTFQTEFDNDEVFGFYDDYNSVSSCMYKVSCFNNALMVNLDYLGLGLVDTSCPPHEGIHKMKKATSHSSDLMNLLMENAIHDPAIWEQVLEDHDVPYLASFFYFIAEDAYGDPGTSCNFYADSYFRDVELGGMEPIEAKSIFYAEYVENSCAEWSQDQSTSVYNIWGDALDLFAISEEEVSNVLLVSPYCEAWQTICEQAFEEVFASVDFSETPDIDNYCFLDDSYFSCYTFLIGPHSDPPNYYLLIGFTPELLVESVESIVFILPDGNTCTANTENGFLQIDAEGTYSVFFEEGYDGLEEDCLLSAYAGQNIQVDIETTVTLVGDTGVTKTIEGYGIDTVEEE